jgi:copper(I)-binding protein
VNRALRAATTVALLVPAVALSACSAGQVTQTNTQERDKVGAMAQVGELTIRAVQLASPGENGYEQGDDADLQMAVVNNSTEDDTLVEVSGEGFGDVEFDTGSTASGVGSSGGSSGGSSSSDEGIEIPAGSPVFVGDDELGVTLTDLDDALYTGQYLELTFTFENAGEITLPVTVATPSEEVDRGEAFDFHHEEGGEEQGSEDAARERESAEGS